jgi:molybdopterin synthase catalytic subunit
MQVRVLFFGILKDLAGRSSDSLELPEGSLVRELLSHYSSQMPRLQPSLASIALAVNHEYAGLETALKSGDEVALLPPVSGGSEKAESETESGSGRQVSIVRDAIDTSAVLNRIKRGEDGAAVVFEGVVRNQTRGRKTLYLDYEAYEEMALQQMEGLAEQALQQFQVRDVALVHRLGRLAIGEISVLIVVASAHRAAAFDACRWLIDTLKRTVPIWKKEHFEDGAIWADGEPFPREISQGSFTRPSSFREPSGGAGSPAKGRASK